MGYTEYILMLFMFSPMSKEWLGRISVGMAYGEESDFDTTASIVKRLLNESNMDPRIRPSVEGEPVKVVCGFFVVSFGSISEVNMDFTMSIYLRQTWVDDRMTFSNHKRVLSLSAKAIDKIWTPDLFFPNEKQASFHMVTTPNKLMKIHPDGTITYSIRLTLKLSCPMNLENFPMDHQTCRFRMESYSMTTDEMVLHWSNSTPVEVSDNVELPQFDLEEWFEGECTSSYKTGDFPCLEATFKLRRQFGFFLLQTYVPTILIVILSWVSFWINMEAVPARISLGVTTVLTMATQLSGSKAAIPRVSYPKAIDVWMSMCMLFVFLALVEYAFVNAMSRKNKPTSASMRKKKHDEETDAKPPSIHTIAKIKGRFRKRLDPDQVDDPEKTPEEEEALPRGFQLLNMPKVMRHNQSARLLDKSSRFLFPAAFVIFNCVYWPVYTHHKLFDYK